MVENVDLSFLWHKTKQHKFIYINHSYLHKSFFVSSNCFHRKFVSVKTWVQKKSLQSIITIMIVLQFLVEMN